MPHDFVYETAITIDHEVGTCRVDTTVRSIATTLRRRGFQETTTDQSRPYYRFLGEARQIRFGSKEKRRVSETSRANLRATRRPSKTP